LHEVLLKKTLELKGKAPSSKIFQHLTGESGKSQIPYKKFVHPL